MDFNKSKEDCINLLTTVKIAVRASPHSSTIFYLYLTDILRAEVEYLFYYTPNSQS